jgi:hypothetical protein
VSVRLIFPRGLTTKQARRLAEIGDALEPIGATEMVDASLYDLSPPARCECCGQVLEGGRCYACKPVWGYGEGFRCVKCAAGTTEDVGA